MRDEGSENRLPERYGADDGWRRALVRIHRDFVLRDIEASRPVNFAAFAENVAVDIGNAGINQIDVSVRVVECRAIT